MIGVVREKAGARRTSATSGRWSRPPRTWPRRGSRSTWSPSGTRFTACAGSGRRATSCAGCGPAGTWPWCGATRRGTAKSRGSWPCRRPCGGGGPVPARTAGAVPAGYDQDRRERPDGPSCARRDSRSSADVPVSRHPRMDARGADRLRLLHLGPVPRGPGRPGADFEEDLRREMLGCAPTGGCGRSSASATSWPGARGDAPAGARPRTGPAARPRPAGRARTGRTPRRASGPAAGLRRRSPGRPGRDPAAGRSRSAARRV